MSYHRWVKKIEISNYVLVCKRIHTESLKERKNMKGGKYESQQGTLFVV